MIILAANSNEKGACLELLTKQLLQELGYKNCTTNVMANGAEIDVTGELIVSSMPQERRQELICECKATKASVDMTQWCKFLGKVYHREACANAEVSGCFISLSGVNGYVQGNYNELHAHKQNISLIQGDDLLALIGNFINFIPFAEVSKRTLAITNRPVSRFEPAYYEGCLFWILVFSAGAFTMLDATGNPISEELSMTLAPIVKAELDVSVYVDLPKEDKAIHRNRLSKVLVLAQLILGNGEECDIDNFSPHEDFTTSELRIAAQSLVDEGLLIVDELGKCKIATNPSEIGEFVKPEVFKLLAYRLPVGVLYSEFYQNQINEPLLEEIFRIQGNLDMPDRAGILETLRLSPTALLRSLTPNEMLVNVKDPAVLTEQLRQFHRGYYRKMVLESLISDFQNPYLMDFYYQAKGFCEIETQTTYHIKSTTKTERTESCQSRIGIAPVDATLGGGLVHLEFLPDSPQPWELMSKSGVCKLNETCHVEDVIQ
jgi:hypothetical protein